MVAALRQLAYELGLRRGEILGLRWGQVDLEKAELTVLSETSKGRRCRTLPLVPELVAALRGWRESCPGEERVLPYLGNVRKLYNDWHKIAGGRVPKNCRSSCGSQMVEAGTPTVVVKDWLGHSIRCDDGEVLHEYDRLSAEGGGGPEGGELVVCITPCIQVVHISLNAICLGVPLFGAPGQSCFLVQSGRRFAPWFAPRRAPSVHSSVTPELQSPPLAKACLEVLRSPFLRAPEHS